MYKGEGAVDVGFDLLAEDITITSVDGYTQDYENDEPTPNTSSVSLRAQVRNLNHNERVRFDTHYDVDKMLALMVPKSNSIKYESTLTRDGINYTIVQIEVYQSHKILYAKND